MNDVEDPFKVCCVESGKVRLGSPPFEIRGRSWNWPGRGYKDGDWGGYWCGCDDIGRRNGIYQWFNIRGVL